MLRKKILFFLIISIIFNIFLSVQLYKTRNTSKYEVDYIGIYQGTFINNYNKSYMITVKLNEDGLCSYDSSAVEYSGKNEKSCTYEISDKNIVISIPTKVYYDDNGEYIKNGIDSTIIYKGEFLSGGSLFLENKKLNKLF